MSDQDLRGALFIAGAVVAGFGLLMVFITWLLQTIIDTIKKWPSPQGVDASGIGDWFKGIAEEIVKKLPVRYVPGTLLILVGAAMMAAAAGVWGGDPQSTPTPTPQGT